MKFSKQELQEATEKNNRLAVSEGAPGDSKFTGFDEVAYTDATPRERIKVRYGLSYHRGNALPHLTITADVHEERIGRGIWSEVSFGCQHDLVVEHFPHLAPLVKFHLTDYDGTPLYYFENGMYWFGKAVEGRNPDCLVEGNSTSDPDPVAAFESTTAWGVVTEDGGRDRVLEMIDQRYDGMIDDDDVREILAGRLLGLQCWFRLTLEHYDLPLEWNEWKRLQYDATVSPTP